MEPIEPPKSRPPALGSLAAAPAPPGPGADEEGLAYADVEQNAFVLSDARLLSCRLDGLTVEDLAADGVHWVDVEVGQATIGSWDGTGSHWRSVAIGPGRIGSLDLSGAILSAVVFSGLRLGFVNLSDSRLSDVVFEDCTLGTLDLFGATCERIALPGSTARELDIRSGQFVHADLRGLSFERIEGIEQGRGISLSLSQVTQVAPQLAAGVGLQVTMDP